jgi:hypothetical protein
VLEDVEEVVVVATDDVAGATGVVEVVEVAACPEPPNG